MKFDVIVGNPPYQINDEGGKRDDGSVNASASPIYQYFVESSNKISRISCLIMPGRWLSGAGKGLAYFTEEMLSDNHIKALRYYLDSKMVFPTVDIKGGVVYYCRDNLYNGKTKITVTTNDGTETSERMLRSASGTFIPFEQLDSILNKVINICPNLSSENVQAITSVLKPYGLRTDVIRDPAKYGLPEMYQNKIDAIKDGKEPIEIFGLIGGKRVKYYLPYDYPIPAGRETIGKWKVFVPKAYGCGALGEEIASPILGSPIQICTETFIRYGSFNTELEAQAAFKYLKGKFFRVMVGIIKTTQDSPSRVYRLVPLQDFTSSSDIDWNKSIHEIDLQLYKKYNLSDEEIDFIETRVREME